METTAEVASNLPDERELVDALRRGEDGAFEALVEEHEALMLRVAAMYVRSRAVAQEVVQDTWVSVLNGIASFEGRSVPFSALSPDDSADPERLPGGSPWAGGVEDHPAHPEQRVITRETMEQAVRAIDRLPDAQRQVIAMRDLQGCSSDEVCSLLGISGGNQRVQLHRARARVKRELESYFSTPASQLS